MPGPDYPWATYIAGAQWRPRPSNAPLTAVILHAQPMMSPAFLAAMIAKRDTAYHYIVTAQGAVMQLVPERGYTTHMGSAAKARFKDPRTIAILVDGTHDQPSWPDEQVTAVAHVLSVAFSVRGPVPVVDAGSATRKAGQFPLITHWPWDDLADRILRLDTPIERLYDAAGESRDLIDYAEVRPCPHGLRLTVEPCGVRAQASFLRAGIELSNADSDPALYH